MQTLSIHEITSIELGEVSHFEKSSNRKAFYVRHLIIVDLNGNKIDIDLFSNDQNALTINADWNQNQSITL
jgi:hypothetical protein